MRVLITGGAGYIGSHTAVALLEAGHELVVLDNFSNSTPDVLQQIEKITKMKVPFYEGDIRDGDVLQKLFSSERIDAVIHMAGLKAVGESVEKPLEYYNCNVVGAIKFFEAMADYGVKKLVFSSSATVYGQGNTSPMVEDMPTGAINPYGRTKWMIEEILQDICRADGSWSVSLLRYFNPVGAHPSGLIGERPSGIPNNLMPYITQVATGERDYLRIFGQDYDTPDGTGIRDYIHVMDLAMGHVAALERMQKVAGAEIINLGTGRGYSVLEVVNAFEKVTGQKIPYQFVPRRPGDLAVCYADVSKAKQLLGWETKFSLEDMCRDAWNWEKKRE